MSPGSLNTKRYIDVTFSTQSKDEKIDGSSITDLLPEFTITGTGANNVKLYDFAPELIAGFDESSDTKTYRYKLTESNPNSESPLFVDGEISINFIKDSFSSKSGEKNSAIEEKFTTDSGKSGKKSSPKTIGIGPLELQGPSIGVEGIGFKDGMLVVSVGIGVDMASLNFGSSESGKKTTKSQKQSNSGISAELKNVLGIFDLKVDVFGLLSGNFNIKPSGKFGLMVGSMEVDVPNAVNVTANGLRVNYDPDYVQGSEANGPTEVGRNR